MDKELNMIKAIAQETRFRIVNIMVTGGKPLCICEIMDSLKKPEYDISRSLNILKNAGILKARRKGKIKLFELNKDTNFKKNLYRNFTNIKNEKGSILEKDLTNLKKRLSLRVNDCCVVTYKKIK